MNNSGWVIKYIYIYIVFVLTYVVGMGVIIAIFLFSGLLQDYQVSYGHGNNQEET